MAGALVGQEALGDRSRGVAGSQSLADHAGRDPRRAERQGDALSRERVVEAGRVAHEEGARRCHRAGLDRQRPGHAGCLDEAGRLEPLRDPGPTGPKSLAEEALDVARGSVHLTHAEHEGDVRQSGGERSDPTVSAAPDMHLAVVVEPLHALPVPTDGKAPQPGMRAAQVEAGGHDALATVRAHDQARPERAGSSVGTLRVDAFDDPFPKNEAGDPGPLVDLRSEGAGPLEQDGVELHAPDRKAGSVLPGIAPLENRSVRRRETHPAQGAGAKRLDASHRTQLLEERPGRRRDRLTADLVAGKIGGVQDHHVEPPVAEEAGERRSGGPASDDHHVAPLGGGRHVQALASRPGEFARTATARSR